MKLILKRIWFSKRIHHHYSNDKFKPEFSNAYFDTLLKETNTNLTGEAYEVIFNDKDAKKVNLDETKGLLEGSATNFYALKINKNDKMPVEFGLNSKLVKNADGSLEEKVWKVGGMYSASIEKMVSWLEKAVEVAENAKQAEALKLLIDYYKTGDLKTWDAYNVVWATSTEGDIDYINGFVEVYNDPIAHRGSFESIVQIKDFDMSKKMAVLAENAQWFEDNSTLQASHKKKNVVGAWAFEKGKKDNVIEKVTKDNKTYFVVRDYGKLRVLFGELLSEIQRIKSEGDFKAGKALVDTYGVKVDQAIHKEVLDRNSKFKSAAYSGFVNPVLTAELDADGNIIDVKIVQPASFSEQMLDYAKRYTNLPNVN